MPLSRETQEQFEREEQAYWQQRDQLLKQHAGKWVAIVGGEVVAVGDQMNEVSAEASGQVSCRNVTSNPRTCLSRS